MIHHTVVGDGPPVVLLHGGTGSSESYWAEQVPVLSEHFQLILMDHRGFGASDYEGTFSIPACAGDLEALLDGLGVGAASLVGLSLGGAIALQFAADRPSRVRRLVLADTFSGVFTQHFGRFIDHALIDSLERGGHDLMFELNLLFAFSERYLAEHEGELKAQKRAWREMDIPRYVESLRAIRDWSIDDRLGDVTAPALVLWGSEDIEVPRVYSDRLATALPHAVLSVIHGAGHKSCADRPEAFNKAVLSFLLDGPPAAGPARASHPAAASRVGGTR